MWFRLIHLQSYLLRGCEPSLAAMECDKRVQCVEVCDWVWLSCGTSCMNVYDARGEAGLGWCPGGALGCAVRLDRRTPFPALPSSLGVSRLADCT